MICSRSTRRTVSSGSTGTEVRDKLPDPRLELNRPHNPHLGTEVAQAATQVVLDGDGLRLQLTIRRQLDILQSDPGWRGSKCNSIN